MIHNKYQRVIRSATEPQTSIVVDVYCVLDAFAVTNPAVAHAIKKLLAPGQRGAKSAIQDLKEAKVSIERAIQMEEAKQEQPKEAPTIWPTPVPQRAPQSQRVECVICGDPNCKEPNQKH